MKYALLCEFYDSVGKNPKRLAKTKALTNLLIKTPSEDFQQVIYLVQGNVFPGYSKEKIGVADRLILKALSLATGASEIELEKSWKTTGDLGEVAKVTITKKRQATLFSTPLLVEKVFSNIRKLVETEGEGSVDRKMQLISELLTSAAPTEAKYVTRTVLGDLRVGVGEGIIRDAIVWAYLWNDIPYNEEKGTLDLDEEGRKKYDTYCLLVQSAYDILNDFAEVALRLKTTGAESIKDVPVVVGKPLKVMLYQKAVDSKDAIATVGLPCACEYKYDGFRLQIHKDGMVVTLFTRRLENVTNQFPDVVKAVLDNVSCTRCILDAEAVGYDVVTGKYIAFQNISQRIRRKYDIQEIATKFPVEVNVFDVLFIERQGLLGTDFIERRKILEKIVPRVARVIMPSQIKMAGTEEEMMAFYSKSLAAGNEGIMAKNLTAPYKPGSRVGYGVKLKPVMEGLDLVIVGAEWGEGKRAGWLTSFTIACQDEEGDILEIGKLGTGIKEKEEEGVSFEELTNKIKPLILREDGREVTIKPEIVIEVHYEEIQKSPTYASGYALRFPRFVRIRDDKPVEEISSLHLIDALYNAQRGRDQKGNK